MKLLTINVHSWLEENQLEKLNILAKTIVEKKYDVIAMQEVNQLISSELIELGIREDNFGKLLLDKIKRADKIVIIHSNAKEIMLSGEKIIPNGFYKFTKYISKKLKLKFSKEFQKGFKNLSKEDLKNVVFLDFKDYEEFSLNKYGFENLKIIYTAGHSSDSISLVYNDEYLFCGDMVQNLFFKYPLIPLFGDDIKELIDSWKKVIDKAYSRIYPATSRSYILREDLIKKLEKYE